MDTGPFHRRRRLRHPGRKRRVHRRGHGRAHQRRGRGKHRRGHHGLPGIKRRRPGHGPGHLRHGLGPGGRAGRGRGLGRGHEPVRDRHALRSGHHRRWPGLRHPGRGRRRLRRLDRGQRRQYRDAWDRGHARGQGGPGDRGEQHPGARGHGRFGQPVSRRGPSCGGRRGHGLGLGSVPFLGQRLRLRRPGHKRPGDASPERKRDHHRRYGQRRNLHLQCGSGHGLRRGDLGRGNAGQGRGRHPDPVRRPYLHRGHHRHGGPFGRDRHPGLPGLPDRRRGRTEHGQRLHPDRHGPGGRHLDHAAFDHRRDRRGDGKRHHQWRRGLLRPDHSGQFPRYPDHRRRPAARIGEPAGHGDHAHGP
ncbi:hypothetical protein ASZ90_000521 [hydrocarbon metagenome]|uniref:Uncharacterized protein n=1 Tax=hydrocarbon metagenome TaxID=938273 RepID=A0A0W8G8V7_9ZZZZ